MRAQDIEQSWWGDCGNTFHEEQKQLVYAPYVGLEANWNVGHPPGFDLRGARVADFGGGPVSLLLKCYNRSPGCTVIDPCPYPYWTRFRYLSCGIEHAVTRGEDFEYAPGFTEAWCYNVLQHVDDPELVARRMRQLAPRVRVFEWIDIPTYDGHPHTLTEADLSRWFGTPGAVTDVAADGAYGRAWYAS